METGEYQAIYSRDINNYFAVKADGSVKRKGEYSTAGLVEKKNPTWRYAVMRSQSSSAKARRSPNHYGVPGYPQVCCGTEGSRRWGQALG